MPALLLLMQRMGVADGVVRTAVSRLCADGWLDRMRIGRTSFYRLGPRGTLEVAAAADRIYGQLSRPWNGRLRVVIADSGADRSSLNKLGYALIAPGVLVAPDSAEIPDDTLQLLAAGEPDVLRAVAGRAWPLSVLGQAYAAFSLRFDRLASNAAQFPPLEAAAVRVLLTHEYRRIVLRDPHLPEPLLPDPWPGFEARQLCAALYSALAQASERWLDTVANRSGPLPRGPDPAARFSDGDR